MQVDTQRGFDRACGLVERLKQSQKRTLDSPGNVMTASKGRSAEFAAVKVRERLIQKHVHLHRCPGIFC